MGPDLGRVVKTHNTCVVNFKILECVNDEQPPTECLGSDSELACDGIPILFDSWGPSTLKALNEKPLDFVLDATESGLLE